VNDYSDRFPIKRKPINPRINNRSTNTKIIEGLLVDKFVKVTVTTSVDYVVPVFRNGKTFDGKEIDELLKEWFSVHHLSRHHATRDCHKVTNSEKILGYKIQNTGK